MVDGTAKLIVDLGNSETRVITQFGVNGKGKIRQNISFLDNRYGVLPEDKVNVYLTNQIYTEEDSSIFYFEGADGKEPWCNGEICNTELTTTERPTALVKKYESLASRLTITNALRRGYEDIAEMVDCDIESVNVSWSLVLLLPPEDVDSGSKKLADLAKSITSIDFLMPKLKKNITIEGVTIYPEGFCAYIAVLLETKNKIRSKYAYLADPDETTLIVDIGAGTTDFTMAKGNKIITSSRFTREIGGNNVHRRVGKALRNERVNLPDSVVRKGVETGIVKSGSREIDIKDKIALAKRDVSKMLVDAVQEFFEDNMMSIQSINNILVVGGGAIESDVEGIEPIADYIIEYMKALSPDIRLVDLPCEEGSKLNPRLLNVLGAAILAA